MGVYRGFWVLLDLLEVVVAVSFLEFLDIFFSGGVAEPLSSLFRPFGCGAYYRVVRLDELVFDFPVPQVNPRKKDDASKF